MVNRAMLKACSSIALAVATYGCSQELTPDEVVSARCDAAQLLAGGQYEQSTRMVEQYRRYGIDIQPTPELTEAANIARGADVATRLRLYQARGDAVGQWVYACARVHAKRM